MAEQQHSIVDQPATAEACARDYSDAKKNADDRKSDSAGAVADLRGRGMTAPRRR